MNKLPEEDIIQTIPLDEPVKDTVLPASEAYEPVPETATPASQNRENLFDENEPEKIFEDVEQVEQTPERASTPLRAMTAGIASLTNKPGMTTENNTLQLLQEAVGNAQGLLDMMEDKRLRYESAGREALEGRVGLTNLKADPSLTPEIRRGIDLTFQKNNQLDLETRAAAALEREAVRNIRTLLTSGNETEARLILNSFDPERNTTLGVQQTNATKRLILANKLEELNVDQKEEGWIHWLTAGALNLLPFNYSLSQLGLVDEGVGGYTPSFFRLFRPGTELNKQAEALNSLSLDEFAKNLPSLVENLRSNATSSFDILSDPEKAVQLMTGLMEGQSSKETEFSNIIGTVDIASGLPYAMMARVGSVPFNLVTNGARRAAGASVANAVELTIKEGAEAATKATGLTGDEVIEHSLPSALNPMKLPDDPMVSLQEEVASTHEAVKEFFQEFQLTQTNRFANQEELDAAIDATKNKIRDRVGTELKDFDVLTVPLVDGTTTYKVSATIGKKEGGGFASEAEARHQLERMGIETNEATITGETVVSRRTVSHEEDGYTISGYHGSKGNIKQFKNDHLGTATGANSATKGHFFTNSPEVASGYANVGSRREIRKLDKISKQLSARLDSAWDNDLGEYVGLSQSQQDALITKIGRLNDAKKFWRASEAWEGLENTSVFKKAVKDTLSGKKLDNDLYNALSTYASSREVAKALGWAKTVDDVPLFETLSKEMKENFVENLEEIPLTEASISHLWQEKFLDESANEFLKAKGVKDLGWEEKELFDATVYPVKLKLTNPLVHEFKGGGAYDETSYTKLIEQAQAEGRDGVIMKNTMDPADGNTNIDPHDVYVVFDPQNIRMALNPGRVVEDVSGQFFAKYELDVSENGFYTSPLNPPAQGFTAKLWKNTSQTLDTRLFEKAQQAGNKRNKLQKIIEGNLIKSFKGLQKNDRMWLDQILMKGQNMERWFSDDEFMTIFERATGKVPSLEVRGAYWQYRVNNDIEHTMRNADLYRTKVIKGYESVRFQAQGDQFDLDGVVDYLPTTVPKERVYNLSDDVHYVGDNALKVNRLQELNAQGYVMIKTEKEITLKDGTTVNRFLMRKGDVELRPLRTEQLGYKAGGHRLYAQRYFVKQASKGVQPDTGKEFLSNPNVFVTAPTIKNARDWADLMNQARRYLIDNPDDARGLDELIFQNKKGYPTGKEFLDQVKRKKIILDEPFEAVFDREMPSAYSNAGEDVSNFIDEEEVGFNGYYRTTGKMYYSKKGEHLPDYTGELAPTVDPFEAQSRALYNVAQMSSFSDFKTTSITRWVNSYKRHLNIRELPNDATGSPMAIFANATFARDTPIKVRQMAQGQRESIQRILGFESEFDRSYRNFMRSTAEWIVGDSDNKVRKALSEGVFWLNDNNPVNFLRGLAFDMKLGLLNIGQLVIQTSTMFSAMSLNFKYGKFGVASAIPVNAYFLSKSPENTLDLMAKRGVHKLAGFQDELEFKEYVREAKRTGFFDLGDTHVMVNNAGPSNTFGSLRGGVDAAREMGRFFFYQAEVLNRLTAYRIAYGEAVDKFGREGIKTFEGREFISGRAENYSFNMSNESKSAWQTGLLSVPTQFWAYNVRMIEALTGSNFTGAQKMRLAAAQVGMAGAGGLPVVAGISEYINQQSGVKPDIESIVGTLQRGAIDRIAYELTGADISIGEKYGTGSWSSDLIKDIFGKSEYNEKSFVEMLGGATYGITGSTLGALGEAVDASMFWMTHESGSEEVALSNDKFVGLLNQISTFSNLSKAMIVANYGTFKSNKGTVLADDLPPQDAWFVALGFRPAELDETSILMAYKKNRQESVDEYAQFINNKWQEGIAIPDKFEQNAQEVNAFINMVPPDLKKDVLNRARKTKDPSFHARMLRWKQKHDLQNPEEVVE